MRGPKTYARRASPRTDAASRRAIHRRCSAASRRQGGPNHSDFWPTRSIQPNTAVNQYAPSGRYSIWNQGPRGRREISVHRRSKSVSCELLKVEGQSGAAKKPEQSNYEESKQCRGRTVKRPPFYRGVLDHHRHSVWNVRIVVSTVAAVSLRFFHDRNSRATAECADSGRDGQH